MSLPRSLNDDFDDVRKYDTRINEGSDYQQMLMMPDQEEEYKDDIRLGPKEDARQLPHQQAEEGYSLIEKIKRTFSLRLQLPIKEPEVKKNASIKPATP
jgi:hypothetical protein